MGKRLTRLSGAKSNRPDATSSLESEADFTIIRYAQCWEDADVLLAGLQIRSGDTCLSIASAGDNTLSLLVDDPSHVVAIDLSAAQLACLETRVEAYRRLAHPELLEFLGVRPSDRRSMLYERLEPHLSAQTRQIWSAKPNAISEGIASAGKFERYLSLLRRWAIRTTHSEEVCAALFEPRSRSARAAFFNRHWDNRCWRLLLRIACSRWVLGRLGRDPRFFKFAEGSVSDRILRMTEHAAVDLAPSDNPYLHWIVRGAFGELLPHALRAENFERIRANLDRIELRQTSLEDFLGTAPVGSIDRFNLSDVFEYLAPAAVGDAFAQIARVGRTGGRLTYWNMLVPRHRPPELSDRLRPLEAESRRLHELARTFFYSAFVVEEII